MILRGLSKSVKFQILDTTNLVNEVLNKTGVDIIYSNEISKLTTMSAILSQNVKSSNTRASLSLKSNGALESFIAKTTKNSNIAVKIKINEEKHLKLLEAIKNSNEDEIKKLYQLNDANLHIMVDYGLKEPYSSIFIVKDNLLELAMNEYYEKSEQTKTCLVCSVVYDKELKISKSSGLIFQLLPDGNEDVFYWLVNKLERLTSTATMLENNFSLERIAHLLFENDEEIFENSEKYKGLNYMQMPKIEDIKILETNSINYECDCDEEYMKRAIKISLSKNEIDEIIKEDGFIEIECNFCNQKYRLNSVK